MAARDFFGGVASLFLLLAKIILCLMFALFDRLDQAIAERTRKGEALNDVAPLQPTTS